MSITLDVKKLKTVMDRLKLTEKTARLIIQPLYDTQTLCMYAAQNGYAVMTRYEGAEGLTPDNFPTIINVDMKEMSSLIGLADKSSSLTLQPVENGEYWTLNCELVSTDSDGISIKHELPAYDEAQNKRSLLAQLNFELFDTLTFDNAMSAESAVVALNRTSLITNLTKCSLPDNSQILMSANAHAITTCGSLFAVYINDSDMELAATLNANDAKSLCSLLKLIECDNIYALASDGQLFITDENNQCYIQLSLPVARRSLLTQIEGLHSADYSEHIAYISKKKLLTGIKAFTTLSKDPTIEFKLTEKYIYLNNRITIPLIDNGEHATPITISLNVLTLQHMLNCISTETVCFSTTPDAEITEDGNETSTQRLMRLGEVLDNGTIGAKVYCIV